MNSISDHPEYPTEAAHLAQVLDSLESEIQHLGQLNPEAASEHDSAALYDALREQYADLLSARSQVYFGRLDFKADDTFHSQAFYIGRHGLVEGKRVIVVDWRAPFGSLFSRTRPGRASYLSPDGRIAGDLRLKRQLDVAGVKLRGVRDEYDTRPESDAPGRPAAAAGPAGIIDPDEYLRAILVRQRDAHLQDIVSTIREHQDALIRADHRQALIVQGVVGSGKTSIALHRLAYLLYPGNATGITAARCIIFGPNRLFLDYVSRVLPGLGVGDIPQTTFDAWALQIIGQPEAALTDQAFARLLRKELPARRHAQVARQARLKTASVMGRLLDRYLERWRRSLKALAAGFQVLNLGPLRLRTGSSQARVLEIQQQLAGLPPARQRQRLAASLLSEWTGDYLSQIEDRAGPFGRNLSGPLAIANTPSSREQVRADLAQGLEKILRRAWPEVTPADAWRDLFTSPGLLAELGQDLLPPADLELLAEADPPEMTETIDAGDLPALCYLHTRIHGVPAARYEHIVIDEAQDVPPLYLEALAAHSRNGSYTIVGDLAQALFSHRGPEDWRQVAAAVGAPAAEPQSMTDSYRSTVEIIDFANRVAQAAPIRFEAELARPFNRHGEPVQVLRLASPAAVAKHAAGEIKRLKRLNYRTLAVLARSQSDCAHWLRPLKTALPDLKLLTGETAHYQGGLVLLPVPLAKGMEFEAVFLLDSPAAAFADQTFDARLLYVAATRALHYLRVLALEQPSPMVAAALPQIAS